MTKLTATSILATTIIITLGVLVGIGKLDSSVLVAAVTGVLGWIAPSPGELGK